MSEPLNGETPALAEADSEITAMPSNDKCAISERSLDELCVKMLSLGAMGGCEGGTNEMRSSEIKALLVPFFGDCRVVRGVNTLCGLPNL